MVIEHLIKGIIIGLMVSIPLGPMGVLIIQKTLSKGRLSGFISGMGAASADTFYAILAAFGFGFVITFIQAQQFILQIIASAILVLIGLKIYFANPVKQYRSRRTGKANLLKDYVSLFFLTVTNPVAIVLFIAYFAGTNAFGTNPTLLIEAIVVSGVLIGATLWWYVLTTIINLFRRKFRLRSLFIINRVSGVIITILGAFALVASFEPIKSWVENLF
ncbi:MAG: LysE family transporter [Marinifilaceae bacterium]|jgi:threonine/homoserine/homoserine lactone efflux protein|nr:LysE family transporter [Marinifilaceae bacterium]